MSIEVIVASYIMWSSANTASLRVKLGNDPNFDSNPEFDYHPGIVPRAIWVELKPASPPMSGQYLQLTSETAGNFFGLCEIRIFG